MAPALAATPGAAMGPTEPSSVTAVEKRKPLGAMAADDCIVVVRTRERHEHRLLLVDCGFDNGKQLGAATSEPSSIIAEASGSSTGS